MRMRCKNCSVLPLFFSISVPYSIVANLGYITLFSVTFRKKKTFLCCLILRSSCLQSHRWQVLPGIVNRVIGLEYYRQCVNVLLTYILTRPGQLSLLTDAIIQLNILEEYI